MKRVDIKRLAALQQNAANIRNICILAHVDHGKTTLADALVASNGIISQRLAGKLRYLDSREDEQLRGITMKSSAISLHYNKDVNNEYLINLIDSPGHIDFSSEVSTAVRLCDGAIIVVDVVEGVCPQTHAVLRQAWLENIRPVLVLNKIDRLVTELKMTPAEAHRHLLQTLEQVNAITGELFTSDVFAKSSQNVVKTESMTNQGSSDQVFDWSSGLEDTDDSQLYFCPDQGNVVFASAADGWGFRLEHFAKLYARKVGISEKVLRQTLWGDYYVDTKAKCVKKGAQSKNKKTVFVQLVLDNIWTVYDAVVINRDKEMIAKIVWSLDLKVPPVVNDPRVYLQSLFAQWLPLSEAVLAMVCELLPSPLMMSSERVEKLLSSRSHPFNLHPPKTQQLKHNFMSCDSSESAPVVVFVSKMFPVDVQCLPQNRVRPLTAEEIAEKREALKQRMAEKQKTTTNIANNTDQGNGVQPLCDQVPVDTAMVSGKNSCDQVFIAFGRVFSGTVRRGQKLYILGPKHDPAKVLKSTVLSHTVSNGHNVSAMDTGGGSHPVSVNGEDTLSSAADCSNGSRSEAGYTHIATVDISNLYMFMGRELESLDEIPAGNILGIGGLEDFILKSAAVSSTLDCPAFSDMHIDAAPIVRVAIEPRNMGDMETLVHGLKLLNQSDPCVEVLVQETGEHVIITAGEVHLQKCLDDLRLRFSKIDIDVSAPIVPFRETIVRPPTTDRVHELIQDDVTKPAESMNSAGVVEMLTVNRQCLVRMRAAPLPAAVSVLLTVHADLIKMANKLSAARSIAEKCDILSRISDNVTRDLALFRQQLDEAFKADNSATWTDVVDRIWSFSRSGTNILVNSVEGYDRPSLWNTIEILRTSHRTLREFDSAVVSGFQIATQYGPLCEEPMMGVCFIVERWDVGEAAQQINTADQNTAALCEELRIADDTQCVTDLMMKQETRCQQLVDTSKQHQLSGQLISCIKEACRKAFQQHPQRLMWAMYTCVIQATADVLGKMYAVLGKRNGRVLSDELREGSSMFNVTAVLPVIESFGFAEEIRKRTSGLASPQLQFSHWEVIDIDPFWVPTTEEEITHFGEKADSENIARKHMNAIRRRKGLHVNEKIVEFAEKQRTLKKNK